MHATPPTPPTGKHTAQARSHLTTGAGTFALVARAWPGKSWVGHE